MKLPVLPYRDVTPEPVYRQRREFLRDLVGVAALSMAWPELASAQARLPVSGARKSNVGRTDEKVTPFESASTYNNFYELSRKKELPAELAGTLRPAPWSVRVDGETEQPATYAIEDLVRTSELEERVYRHRCVEGWSMVVPWIGVPLAGIVNRLKPKASAKYVSFTTLNDPEQLPGLKEPVLPWPYTEALRLDEARHPLTLLAVGMYGRPLPGQNGAPLRLVVPWKYGFKGGKSIVRIAFTDTQPATTWNIQKPHEYGFYANVNPEVDHPRWSQATERRIGEFFKRKTLMFNGYADQVASLYTGLNLRTNF